VYDSSSNNARKLEIPLSAITPAQKYPPKVLYHARVTGIAELSISGTLRIGFCTQS
jgi:hypothetical protein